MVGCLQVSFLRERYESRHGCCQKCRLWLPWLKQPCGKVSREVERPSEATADGGLCVEQSKPEDMLYSGHTYFTILYILALCELIRKACSNEFGNPESPKFLCLGTGLQAISGFMSLLAAQGTCLIECILRLELYPGSRYIFPDSIPHCPAKTCGGIIRRVVKTTVHMRHPLLELPCLLRLCETGSCFSQQLI